MPDSPQTEKLPIPELNNAAVAFGDISALPAWEDIPEEFRKNWHSNSQPWCRIISQLFFKGGTYEEFGLTAKDGVDEQAAKRAIHSCLGSWTPKHEHKIAGCGYMLSQWFDRADAKRAAE